MFLVFKPLLLFNFARNSSAPLVSRKALITGTRRKIRNLGNVALLWGWGEVCARFSLVPVSSCMTGIIRLNEVGCLSCISSTPLFLNNPSPPPKKDGRPLTSLGLQMPCCVQLFILSVLGCPVLRYKLTVLLSLNHLCECKSGRMLTNRCGKFPPQHPVFLLYCRLHSQFQINR